MSVTGIRPGLRRWVRFCAPQINFPFGEVAAQLCLEHHTVVELVDRLETGGLLLRRSSSDDRRVVALHLTRSGHAVQRRIVSYSLAHLREEAPELIRSLQHILRKPRGS